MAPASGTTSTVLNAVLYHIGWFACVLGAASGVGTLGALVALILVGAHLVLAERPDQEWQLVLTVAAIGVFVDSLHAALGILDFRGHQAGSLAPLWLVALWLQFGTVLHFCMRWLSQRYLVASMLGLVGGPLAFLGGERLGAASFGEPRLLSLALLGLSWSLLLPLLVLIADRLGGVGRYRLVRFRARDRSGLGADPQRSRRAVGAG